MKNTSNEKNLEISILDSIATDNLSQIGTDTIEIFTDSILEEGLLKEIPVFGLLYKSVKTGIAIRDQLTAKKILKFLFEIKDIPIEKRRDFAIELEQYEGSRQTAGETILILLDKLDHLFKSQIIGKLAKAKTLEKITVDRFLRLSHVVQRVFVHDFSKLYDFQPRQKSYGEDVIYSLENVGLVANRVIDGGDAFSIEEYDSGNYKITQLGQDLVRYGLQ